MAQKTTLKWHVGLFTGGLMALLLVACGGGGGETDSGAASQSATEGGGNGGANGGTNGGTNGGGEGGGAFNIVFPPGAVCGVNFVAPLANLTGGANNQKQFDVFTPCLPQQNGSFRTNDGVVNPVAKECNASARAIYEPEFNVINQDC